MSGADCHAEPTVTTSRLSRRAPLPLFYRHFHGNPARFSAAVRPGAKHATRHPHATRHALGASLFTAMLQPTPT
ncbi:hypothetical protein LSAT2_011115 [Lamellibrachia satsuma]|nr:hypothetical protein LSAT2_011115 [Lamellibrachia satsuma]